MSNQLSKHLIQFKKNNSIFIMNTQVYFGAILPSLFYYIQNDLLKLALTSNSMYYLIKHKSQCLTKNDNNNKDDKDKNWLKNLVKHIKTLNTKRKIVSYPMCSYISLCFNKKQELCIIIKKNNKNFHLYIQNHGKLKVPFSKVDITTCSYISSKKILRLSDGFKYKSCSNNKSLLRSMPCNLCL